MSTKRTRVAIRTSIAAILAIPFVVPFLFLITVSIRTEADYRQRPVALPSTFTWDHVVDAWNRADLGSALSNSLIVSVVGVVVACLLSMAAAFWFVGRTGSVPTRLRWLIVSGYAFPAVIWLIPLFVIAARQGLTNNLMILGLVYGVSNAPFGVYMMYAFYRQVMGSEILDAAVVDGASTLQQFRYLALPLARPAAAALAALVFVWSFGDLLFAVTFLQDSADWTVPIAAATLVSRQSITVQAQAAAALVALAPSLVVVLFAQRALVRGFGGGSSD